MLGTLAKWLRIYGIDTYYACGDIIDSDLLKISKKEGRILITRDRQLIIDARRENIEYIEIDKTDIDKQIKTVLDKVGFDKNMILSRCLLCNSKVEEIEKVSIKEKVHERIYKNNEKFWLCKKCNKIYWKGTHYEKMFEKIDNLS
jgi:uncharacterized protein with PIN domain